MHALPAPDGCQGPGKDPCLFLETLGMNKADPNKCILGFPRPQAFKATPIAVEPVFPWAMNPIKDFSSSLSWYSKSNRPWGDGPTGPLPHSPQKGLNRDIKALHMVSH